ncbi:hypothetical protein GUJ93_ZPchr0012g21636 [Zizania palustris]|uniref:Ubiquitin-like protease family profile domain-containing protein n=1 Tax=Zizania palustris TaxID=103762 RepID=A0A8J5WNQ8_ZIZPA|nr:hypothetical protein GUJ93_ZPchr0012g21636 [Zizania palustris]
MALSYGSGRRRRVDGDEGQRADHPKNARRWLVATKVSELDGALPTCCGRWTSRRVRCPPPVDGEAGGSGGGGEMLEEATIEYIEAQAGRKDKLLVSSERPHVRVRAGVLRCLTVPLSRDGPERQISGVILDAALELVRLCQAGRRRNGRRVLLEPVEEQDWLEHVSRLPRTTTSGRRLAEQDVAAMSATAAKYLAHDMVFFPVNHQDHFFVSVLDLVVGEYQVLDSANYGHRFGSQFYETAMSKIRDGIGRCMAAAGRPDVAGWALRRVPGLPPQTDDSSCGLFAIKFMELWDGEKLARNFSMDDVHALRTKLAKELIFWELNEMEEVKAKIESIMARKTTSSSSPVQIEATMCNAALMT